MTTERSYRPAISHEDALAELRRCAGTHFDRDVVEAIVAVSARRVPARRLASVA
jgi:HD-GYP domain-containing protein (c-di-GMP phosphodiesterase class II)